MDSLAQKWQKINNEKYSVIEEGTPTRYRLEPKTNSEDQFEHYRKLTFGARDENKPHKTILMMGETGTGKTTMINAMINYMLGVKREDKVWFEITDDQSKCSAVHSQTSSLTVYEFYLEESLIDLTIIDTPGYGHTQGDHPDKEIGRCLLSLSQSAEGIHEIDAVCLVIKAVQTRLYDYQKNVFHAVQSLFGRDMSENIVLLLTHSRGAYPKHVLKAVEEVKLRCAVDEQKQPVFFLFDNCQGETFDEVNNESMEMLEQSWSLSFKGMTQLYTFIDNMEPKTLKLTQDVLQKWKMLEENVFKIKSHVENMEQKKNDLKQNKEALEKYKEHVNFEEEIEEISKEKIDISHYSGKNFLSCNTCERSCPSEVKGWMSALNDNRNDVCKECKCKLSEHTRSSTLFLNIPRKVKKVNEVVKKEHDDKIRNTEFSIKTLEEELHELEKEKIKRTFDAFYCVEILQKTMLNPDSLNTFLYADYLIEKLKEINESEKVKTLEDLKGEERKQKEEMQCIKK